MPGTRTARVTWQAGKNEQERPLLWFGSWLVGEDGEEGDWFYSGFGETPTEHEAPEGVTGIRIRRWPSEGLDPEYVDIPLAERVELDVNTLDFYREQAYSRLRIASQLGAIRS